MTRFIIGLGSNIDPEANIAEAIRRLRGIVRVTAQSAVRRTAPLGFADQPDFLNTAVCAESPRAPEALTTELKRIEYELGRRPSANKNGPRPIDLDILVVGDQIVDTDVPRRDFLKSAVLELAPELAGRLAD